MSKLQVKKFFSILLQGLQVNSLIVVPPLDSTTSLTRELTDIESPDLTEMVLSFDGIQTLLQQIADLLTDEEFERMFDQIMQLKQDVMDEILRRDDVSQGLVSYLKRVVYGNASSDRLESLKA